MNIKWGYLIVTFCLLSCSRQYLQEVNTSRSFIEVTDNELPSKRIDQAIAPFRLQLEGEMKQQIGTATRELNNHPGKGESILGNFVADLILIQSQIRAGTKVDISLINAHGGLRVPIPKGPILVESIYEVMPFENTIYLYELKSNEVQQLFDHCAATLRSVVGGATFKASNGRAIDIMVGGKSLEADRTYILAISDYLSAGGHGFGFVGQTKFVADIKYLQRDMIIDYIKDLTEKGLEVNGKFDRRMEILEP